MEDKVIGPLTLQQFFYLLFGGLFIYLLNSWTYGSPFRFFFWLIAVPIALLSFALAFIKIQERPFLHFLGSLVKYMRRPRTRVWQKGQYQKLAKIVDKPDEAPKIEPHKDLDRARVQDVVNVLDQPKNDG